MNLNKLLAFLLMYISRMAWFEKSRIKKLKNIFNLILRIIFSDISPKMLKNSAHSHFLIY